MTTQPPAQDEIWQHTNGRHYKVLFITNTAVVREGHDPDVVYASGPNKWSRPLSDWHRSFTKVEDAPTPAQDVSEGHVTVTVSGPTGSGKSAIAMEIEILCRALGLQVSWDDDGERNMTGGDSAAALALYKPRVTIIEQNIPRAS